ncbi:MAG: Nucleolar protein 12 [Caeruleum heppii]|nr:MAG: Nucleolar protein 12 [Caeruleum heppii]
MKRKHEADEVGSSTGSTLDPSLTSLFASSAGAVKAPLISRYRDRVPPKGNTTLLSSNDLLGNEKREDQGEDEEDNDIERSDFSSEEDLTVIAGSPEAYDQSSRKRKRRENDDDVEGAFLARLALEERKDAVRTKRERLATDVQSQTQSDEATDHGKGHESKRAASSSHSEEESVSDSDAKADLPQHESIATPHFAEDSDKASRTVFLANVASVAITSKTAKKTLLRHLASCLDVLPDPSSHKVESIRFRSTAFATSAVPKKAAFAKKEVMDATTKSTNAYVVYTTAMAAREAARKLNGTVVLDRHLRVDEVAHPAKTDNRRCVFVGNLGFVDDESLMNAAKEAENGEKRTSKTRPPADVEEGLWRQFGKAGTVESVRVIRDPQTRVGKGFAYVQFVDANAVEAALLYNEKRYPPMLPRKLRVTRARAVKKMGPSSSSRSLPPKKLNRNGGTSSELQSLQGRAGKLFGRAGAAHLQSLEDRNPAAKKAHMAPKTAETVVFEGHRASKQSGRATVRQGGSGKKKGKPRTRSSKRGTAWKTSGGRKG